MLALSLSGIDLKTFALTSSFIHNEKNISISLDANKMENILLIESSVALKIDDHIKYINEATKIISELYKKFKTVLLKKLNLISAN
jgi:hypothetical protein